MCFPEAECDTTITPGKSRAPRKKGFPASSIALFSDPPYTTWRQSNPVGCRAPEFVCLLKLGGRDGELTELLSLSSETAPAESGHGV